ncbi:hypothetical protein JAAARDRAFT_29807 [Jaapia argillacea MUCL 33604]|uniref:Uncharacterized protein n=1 Tax=Jaapia argillacea MUCL 33604 TaxID=933084 RepID=A0A067QJR4_9AGAM|nr:hypothetical protein JAAARDRAFT_29807 [Jaapia argillacea MUCL 33604]
MSIVVSSPQPLAACRRRSQSASTPSPSPVPELMTNDPWRCSTKRAHPHQPFSPSYREGSPAGAPQKWDVDMWRRGKRARKDLSPPYAPADDKPFRMSPRRLSLGPASSIPTRSPPPTPLLPSNSSAFNLFPDRHRSSRVTRHTVGSPDPQSSPPSSELSRANPDDADLGRLRSDAFWELRKTIAERDEGFVRRMRDWEESRSRSNLQNSTGSGGVRRRTRGTLERGRRRPSSHYGFHFKEDEDDVIFIEDTSIAMGSPSSNKKRALSLGDMELDPFPGLIHPQSQCPVPSPPPPGNMEEESEWCSSPVDTSISGPSGYSSDDDLADSRSQDQLQDRCLFASSVFHPTLTTAYTPALSHTESTNSSLVSLPLPPPLHLPSQPGPISSAAARSEKAIAALSLALANGGASLNDYEALRALQGVSVMDACEVGEMWD